jgi:hypothetical protein
MNENGRVHLEIQGNVRSMAEAGVEQARKAFEGSSPTRRRPTIRSPRERQPSARAPRMSARWHFPVPRKTCGPRSITRKPYCMPKTSARSCGCTANTRRARCGRWGNRPAKWVRSLAARPWMRPSQKSSCYIGLASELRRRPISGHRPSSLFLTLCSDLVALHKNAMICAYILSAQKGISVPVILPSFPEGCRRR